MALVSSTPLLTRARRGGYGVVAFNVHTLEMLQAVVDAAQEARAPLILQTTAGTVQHLGADYIAAAAKVAADSATVPIALHLDHCQDFDVIVRCLRAGYTSVMIDASMRPFADNVAATLRVVEVARALGVNVEAELGKVGGVEDDIRVEDADALLADPDECGEFVRLTGVPTLAPAIGTAHGLYRGEPRIDFGRLERIAAQVAVPLVLHGGSGIPAGQMRRCVALGMAKVNVGTEMKHAFSGEIRRHFAEHPAETDPRRYMAPAKAAVKELARAKMELCGCAGRADEAAGERA